MTTIRSLNVPFASTLLAVAISALVGQANAANGTDHSQYSNDNQLALPALQAGERLSVYLRRNRLLPTVLNADQGYLPALMLNKPNSEALRSQAALAQWALMRNISIQQNMLNICFFQE